MNGFVLYFKYIRMLIVSQMAYKMSFALMSFGNLLIQVIEFIGILALFERFSHINGWTLYEVSVFYGVIHCAFAVSECIGRGYDMFHVHVKKGTFDRMLLRPRSLGLQIMGNDFDMTRIGRFTQGLLVLIFGLVNLNQTIKAVDILMIIAAMVGGILVFSGLFVLQATLSFYTVEGLEVANAFTYGGSMMAQYPVTIYKNWFQKVFLYLIPIGAVSYVPLSAMLRNGHYISGLMVPLAGLVFFVATQMIFHIGKGYYTSTGS